MEPTEIIGYLATFLAQFVVIATVYYQKIKPDQKRVEDNNTAVLARLEVLITEAEAKDDRIQALLEETNKQKDVIMKNSEDQAVMTSRVNEVTERMTELESRHRMELMNMSKENGQLTERIRHMEGQIERTEKLASVKDAEVQKERTEKLELSAALMNVNATMQRDYDIKQQLISLEASVINALEKLSQSIENAFPVIQPTPALPDSSN